MNFYYRSLPENRCEVVCTRCFRTLGAGRGMDEISRIENSHQCAARQAVRPAPRPFPIPAPRERRKFPSLSLRLDRHSLSGLWRRCLLVVLAALALYVLPTALEFAAMRHWNPWVSTVLPGDVAGCVCLGILFRRRKAAALLYCLLTIFEAGAYGLHIMPLDVLVWFTDLVPTLAVAAMVLRSTGSGAKLIPIE